MKQMRKGDREPSLPRKANADRVEERGEKLLEKEVRETKKNTSVDANTVTHFAFLRTVKLN